MRKILILLFLLALAGCAAESETTKIGVIVPLTGPAAITGEMIKNGIEMAKEDLELERKDIKLIYEDSQALSKEGLTAYNKLTKVNNVDIIISTFSRVTVPLVELADADQIPLIATVVSADHVADRSPYSFRLFSTSKQRGELHFDLIESKGYKKIATLNVEDEYGESVYSSIEKKANELGIEIVAKEKFSVGSNDFKAQLNKIKNSEAEALLLVFATPGSLIETMKQAIELDLGLPLFESSEYFEFKSTRDAVVNYPNEIYGLVYPSKLDRDLKFFDRYKEKYGEEAIYSAAFGYDSLKLVGKALDNQKEGEDLADTILNLKTFQSLNGELEIQPNGEINPDTISVQVLNGELVLDEQNN